MSTDTTNGGGRKKPVRRVRVIEVIDEGDEVTDIEEVLATLDAAEARADAPKAKANTNAPQAKAKTDAPDVDAEADAPEVQPESKAEAKSAARSKPQPDDETAEADDGVASETKAAAAKETSDGSPRAGLTKQPVPGGLITAGALVVALAVVASLAIWGWSAASNLQAQKDERTSVARATGDFASSMFSYDAAHLQQQMDHASSLMTGDLAQRYRKNIQVMQSAFAKNPTMKLTATPTNVVVGDIRKGTVTVVVQIQASLSAGTNGNLPSTGTFVITMTKDHGSWKAKDISAADPTAAAGSGLPDIGGTSGASPSPSPSTSPSK